MNNSWSMSDDFICSWQRQQTESVTKGRQNRTCLMRVPTETRAKQCLSRAVLVTTRERNQLYKPANVKHVRSPSHPQHLQFKVPGFMHNELVPSVQSSRVTAPGHCWRSAAFSLAPHPHPRVRAAGHTPAPKEHQTR